MINDGEDQQATRRARVATTNIEDTERHLMAETEETRTWIFTYPKQSSTCARRYTQISKNTLSRLAMTVK